MAKSIAYTVTLYELLNLPGPYFPSLSYSKNYSIYRTFKELDMVIVVLRL